MDRDNTSRRQKSSAASHSTLRPKNRTAPPPRQEMPPKRGLGSRVGLEKREPEPRRGGKYRRAPAQRPAAQQEPRRSEPAHTEPRRPVSRPEEDTIQYTLRHRPFPSGAEPEIRPAHPERPPPDKRQCPAADTSPAGKPRPAGDTAAAATASRSRYIARPPAARHPMDGSSRRRRRRMSCRPAADSRESGGRHPGRITIRKRPPTAPVRRGTSAGSPRWKRCASAAAGGSRAC